MFRSLHRFVGAALAALLLSFTLAAAAAAQEKKVPQDPAIAAIDAQIAKAGIDKKNANWKGRLPKPVQASFDPKKKYFWDLETNKGKIGIRLFSDHAPMHATSAIYLTRLGFYDGVPFHRVIPGFMAQGGDPTGSGSGGPGYSYAGEFGGPERHTKRGILSMANAGPGTDGSQFFITFVETAYLDGKHTVFGEVVSGEKTLDALEAAGTGGSGRPKEPLSITRATIRVE